MLKKLMLLTLIAALLSACAVPVGGGTITTLKRGWPWLDNDFVNLGCAVFGVVVALFLV